MKEFSRSNLKNFHNITVQLPALKTYFLLHLLAEKWTKILQSPSHIQETHIYFSESPPLSGQAAFYTTFSWEMLFPAVFSKKSYNTLLEPSAILSSTQYCTHQIIFEKHFKYSAPIFLNSQLKAGLRKFSFLTVIIPYKSYTVGCGWIWGSWRSSQLNAQLLSLMIL